MPTTTLARSAKGSKRTTRKPYDGFGASMAKGKCVYTFGGGKAEGKGDCKELLGGKGAGLAEMTRIGLPVPAGFTLTTEVCDLYNKCRRRWPPGLEKEVRLALAKLQHTCKKAFGDANDPLLVSVRSGAACSMPGMMETILNLGLNDQSVEGLARAASNRRFAFDAYRRLIMMYGTTAKGIDRELFDVAFDRLKETRTRERVGRDPGQKIVDTDVDADELQRLTDEFKDIYREHCGEEFPQDPFEQLRGAISAVFDSWMAEKAVTYRRVESITGLKGTAVNVCQMVFGNMGDDCGTGVCFTRDPSTGESTFYGDMLINAQGEDVVAGVRTPMKLAELKTLMPEVYDQLEAVRVMLEVHYKDMQDLEFTIEHGKLYMLQCRVGKRSPRAAFKIAVDQATKGLMPSADARRLVKKKCLPAKYAANTSKPIITKDAAIHRIAATDIERLFYPIIDPQVSSSQLDSQRIGVGIGAVPGAACGEVAFSAERAEARAEAGAKVILVRKETSPEDVGGMHAAVGILTATGGRTSHAAVVARGWGKCCIVGCDALSVDYDARKMSVHGRSIREGESVTLDGGSGEIFTGEIPLDRPSAPPEYDVLMGWCDKRRRLKVRTNADTPDDAQKAVEFGAEGIGLCRTEHMFFDAGRITAMREMILADSADDRCRALNKLLPFQRRDFEGLFTAMNGKPVTIRLLDPPLHEFLPQHDNPAGLAAVANELNGTIPREHLPVEEWKAGDNERTQIELEERRRGRAIENIRRRVEQLEEANPMLGHRGCRLCVTFPEILEMQVRAIIEAAVDCTERGIDVQPEIMIPLSIDAKELSILVDHTRAVADAILSERTCKLKYLVGTMIETPRAALLADRLAKVSEFFSFGTNDLTQFTMALSRDDAGRFLHEYVDQNKAAVFAHDPFQSLDTEGVGTLVRMACESSRASHKNIKLGICGEHGGDPASIHFCEQVGLDYVSCSPFRVPIARLAAAQAAIEMSVVKLAPRPVKARSATASRAGKSRPTTGRRSSAKKAKSTKASPKKKTGAKKTTRAVAKRKTTKKKNKR